MTETQKYNELFKALGELIANKDIILSAKDYQIDNLKQKLASAETRIKELEAKKDW